MGVYKCVAPDCGNTSADKSKSFFAFPREPVRCHKWLRFCGLEDLYHSFADIKSTMKICSDHFDGNDYNACCSGARRFLHNSALPSVHSNGDVISKKTFRQSTNHSPPLSPLLTSPGKVMDFNHKPLRTYSRKTKLHMAASAEGMETDDVLTAESCLPLDNSVTSSSSDKMTSTTEKPATIVSAEELRCFVCDVTVTGRYYTLATCRTQSTKIRLIEKLGQLVGERYMVVISEDDIICRGCANLMNTLDRLETEMGSVRNVVLRFLEKKYSLEEGELLNNKMTSFCPPPQITSHNTSIISGSKPKINTSSENFMARKRKAALAEMENEQDNSFSNNSMKYQKNDPKSNVWMQCDRCKYTTHYNAFMIHHIRQHVKKKNPTCDYCGDEVQEGGTCARQCSVKKSEDPKVDSQFKSHPKHFKKYIAGENGEIIHCESIASTESETVEMIAAEINGFKSSGRCTESPDVVISTVQTSEAGPSKSVLPTIHESVQQSTTAIIIDQSQHEDNSASLTKGDDMTIEVSDVPEASEENVEVQLNDVEGSTPTAICVMDMSEDNSAEQPTLLTVQKMEEEGNAVYVQVVEVGKGEEVDENMTKQVLTVSEDGTVEMVEVMWDDVVSPDVGSEQDMNFG